MRWMRSESQESTVKGSGMSLLSRMIVLVGVTTVLSCLGTVQPSYACGCGAMIGSGDAKIAVARESSIVRFDGTTEQIVMRLSVNTRAHDAAWVMPTPSPAQVTLGDASWFNELDRLAAPKAVTHKHWWPQFSFGVGSDRVSGAAPAPGVKVLDQRKLGPFEVASLAADDPRALADWLTAHGYRLRGALAEGLKPYVAERWAYTAIRLAPQEGESLSGTLDPISLMFPSPSLVYPMRLSRLADSTQSVHLYVLAPHRVELQMGNIGISPVFAGRVDPTHVSSPGLRKLAAGTFMTDLVGFGILPSSLTDDFHFTYTKDTPYQMVVDVDGGLVTFLGVPAFLWIIFGVLAAVALWTRRRRSRRHGRVLA